MGTSARWIGRLGASEGGWLAQVRMGFNRLRPTGPHQLGKKCTWAATDARMVVLARSVRLARLLGWLASLGDGPMDPSP
jgi:hypothetical protein